MSTAHRPTWVAALGGTGLRDGATSAPTNQHSAKDMPAHTKLKYRQIGQDAPEEIASFRRIPEEDAEDSTAAATLDLDADTDIEDDEQEKDIQEEDDNGSSDEESEEDETEELMRELEKIKREREQQRMAEAAKRDQEILSNNPLINLSSSSTEQASSQFGVKRRWDDDVVFKNQAKGVDGKAKRRFINDTTRSDFHRKFLDKFIR